MRRTIVWNRNTSPSPHLHVATAPPPPPPRIGSRRTMDRLEIAFMKDKFNDSDYEDSCRRLITKFRALSQTLGMDGARLDEFKTTFHLHKCRRANARFSVGVPATQEHGQATTSAAGGDTAAMGRIFALMEEFWFFQDKVGVTLSRSA